MGRRKNHNRKLPESVLSNTEKVTRGPEVRFTELLAHLIARKWITTRGGRTGQNEARQN